MVADNLEISSLMKSARALLSMQYKDYYNDLESVSFRMGGAFATCFSRALNFLYPRDFLNCVSLLSTFSFSGYLRSITAPPEQSVRSMSDASGYRL